MTAANDLAVRRALEMVGVEFIAENGGGAGARLRLEKRRQKHEPDIQESYRLPVLLR